ncbi:hypothetical protein JGH00_22585 [Salmonella enterica subsp. enterica serovar London]|nr:hypothetical protein [Salmonella enterica subsp. enterica serovar London]
MEKAHEYQKSIYMCFIDYKKAFDCVDHDKLWRALHELGVPTHLVKLLQSLHKPGSHSANIIWGHWLVQDRERSMTRMYSFPFSIQSVC